MNNQTIVCFIVALLLGMLLANMLKNVCGCKVVEGQITDGSGPRCISDGTPAYDGSPREFLECERVADTMSRPNDCYRHPNQPGCSKQGRCGQLLGCRWDDFKP